MTLPDFASISTWIDLGLGVLIAALFTFILYRITNRKFVLFYAILSSLAIILAWFFSLELLTIILTIVLMTSATVGIS